MSGFAIFLGEMSFQFFLFMSKEIFFAAVLFIPVFVLTVLLRKRSPVWEFGLLILVLVRLALPPGFSIPALELKALSNIQSVKKINSYISGFNILERQKSGVQSQIVSSNQNPGGMPESESSFKKVYVGTSIPFWPMAIIIFWLIGFLITLTLQIRSHIHFRRIVSNAKDLDDKQSFVMLTHWKKVFRMKRRIRVVYSNLCLAPFTIGIIKPVIFIPQVMLEPQKKDLLNSVFAHEMAHIKNFDDLWIKFQNLLQSIYFFFPVVWYVNSRIHVARECIRDSQIIAVGKIPPKKLGQHILSLARMNLTGSDSFLYLSGFGNEKKKVSFRLKNLEIKPVLRRQRILINSILVLSGAMIFPLFASLNSSDSVKSSFEKLAFSQVPPEREVNIRKNFQLSEAQKGTSNEDSDGFFKPMYPESEFRDIRLFLPADKPRTPAEVETATDSPSVIKNILDSFNRSESLPPLRLEGQYTPPKLIKRIKPEYPQQARQRRIEGVVILEATTDEFGSVQDVKVLRSIPAFDQAALEAVRQWVYEPMVINGRPRGVIFKVTVNFKLIRPVRR